MTAASESQTAGVLVRDTASTGSRAGSRLINGWWAGSVMVAVAGAVLTGLAWGDFKANDGISQVGSAVSTVAYSTLGALIVRRVRNPIGWLLLTAGAGTGLMALFSAYAMLGITAHPGALPAAGQVGGVSEWIFFPVVTAIACAFLLFPTGTLPSRRWRPVVALNLLATGLLMIGFILVPRPVALPAPGGYSLTYENPFRVTAIGRALSGVPFNNFNSLTFVSVLFLGAGALSLVVRYRAGRGELRRQINWVALAGAAFALVQLIAIAGIVADHGKQPPITGVAYGASAVIGLLGFPAAITVGILKYRLYEIDVIINRAVVYGLVSAGLTAVYAGIVLGIGALAGQQGSPVLTIAAAVAVALLFHPARQRARRVANRLVYGERATPYQVISDFADDVAGQLDYEKAVAKMVSVLASATGATRAEAWIRVGHELRPVTIWPHGSTPQAALPLADGGQLPAFEAASRAVAVRHSDELLGALALHKQSPSDAAFIRQLTPELQKSARAALDDLRALARGIYPPLLADQGLVLALQAQARRAALPVTIEADGIQRYPQDAEATVYFCALEALQNVAKYADASRADIRLSCSDGSLQFTVADDGAGFDTAAAQDGTGLQGMADRLAALGGTLQIRSQPGHGTAVSGRLPVPEPRG